MLDPSSLIKRPNGDQLDQFGQGDTASSVDADQNNVVAKLNQLYISQQRNQPAQFTEANILELNAVLLEQRRNEVLKMKAELQKKEESLETRKQNFYLDF